jgi:hypothetical protein
MQCNEWHCNGMQSGNVWIFLRHQTHNWDLVRAEATTQAELPASARGMRGCIIRKQNNNTSISIQAPASVWGLGLEVSGEVGRWEVGEVECRWGLRDGDMRNIS